MRTTASSPQLVSDLAGEARLADTRRPEHRDQPAAPLATACVEGRAHSRELARAADERRVEPPLVRRRASTTRTRRCATKGSAFPLSVSGSTGIVLDGAARERARRSPSRISSGAAACSRRAATLTASPVASRSSCRRPPRRCSRRCARAGGAVVTLQLLVEGCHGLAQLGRRAKGAQRVVLVRRGTPKTAITASPMNFSTEPPWRSRHVLAQSRSSAALRGAATQRRATRRARSSP